jgi:hypothetical protein
MPRRNSKKERAKSPVETQMTGLAAAKPAAVEFVCLVDVPRGISTKSMYQMPVTPADVIKINDSVRRTDASDDLLLKFTDYHSISYPPLSFTSPILAPEGWTPPITREFSGDLYEKYFGMIAELFPPVLDIMLRVRGTVIAGSAACYPLHGNNPRDISQPDDVDIFFHGLQPHEIMENAYDFINEIKSYCDTVTITEQKGLISLECKLEDSRTRFKVQLILRCFRTIHSILAGFDLGAPAVATDGREIYFTVRGAWCNHYKMEIVNPAYSSTTYDQRLRKYFRDKGYAVAFPGMKPFADEKKIQLNFISIELTRSHKMFGVGHIYLNEGYCAESDYDALKHLSTRNYQYRIPNTNLSSFIHGECIFARRINCKNDAYLQSEWSYNPPTGEFDCINTIPELPKKVSNYITANEIRQTFDGGNVYRAVENNCINPFWLCHVLRASSEETAQICMELYKKVCERRMYTPLQLPTFAALIKRRRAETLERFEICQNDQVELVIVDDPSRQYTVSLNPTIVNPVDWYSEKYYCSAAPEYTMQDEFFDKACMLGYNLTVEANDCPICFESINAQQDSNICKTQCGHYFHMNKTDNCGGFVQWVMRNPTCPICRTNLS